MFLAVVHFCVSLVRTFTWLRKSHGPSRTPVKSYREVPVAEYRLVRQLDRVGEHAVCGELPVPLLDPVPFAVLKTHRHTYDGLMDSSPNTGQQGQPFRLQRGESENYVITGGVFDFIWSLALAVELTEQNSL